MPNANIISNFRRVQDAVARTTAVALALVFAVANSKAQGPTELKSSSAHRWHNYIIDTANFYTLHISLPKFFTRYHDPILESGPPAASAEFKPSNDSLGTCDITIWESTNPNQFYKGLSDALKRTKDSILSKHISKSSVTVWTEPHPSNREYVREGAHLYINYVHSFTADGRVYEIVINFDPQYRKVVTAILPRILSSFRITKNS